MKKAIKHILLFLLFIFSFSIVNGQDFKSFTVKNGDRTRTIIPNFIDEPDFDNMEKGLMPKSVDNYTRSTLEKKFPNLFKKVEHSLDKNERFNFVYFYNEKGDVVYGYFLASEVVIKKLTDELLLEIYNTFKGMKIEIDPKTIKSGAKMYEVLTMPFRGK